jgi:Tfp pilus assembly protein PilO
VRRKVPDPKIFFGLALLAVLGGGGLCYFQWSSISDIQDKIAALKKEGVDEKSVNKEYADAQTQLGDLKAKLAHLEAGVPAFAYMPTMLKELETTGKQYGIEVLGVRPVVKAVTSPIKNQDSEDKPSRKPYEEQDIEVKGRGHFGDVMRFVQGLNNFPKIVAARTVSMEPKGQSSGVPSDLLDVTVTLRAYLFKDQKPIAASGQTAMQGSTKEGRNG